MSSTCNQDTVSGSGTICHIGSLEPRMDSPRPNRRNAPSTNQSHTTSTSENIKPFKTQALRHHTHKVARAVLICSRDAGRDFSGGTHLKQLTAGARNAQLTITTEPSVESSRLLASKLQWITGLVAFLAGHAFHNAPVSEPLSPKGAKHDVGPTSQTFQPRKMDHACIQTGMGKRVSNPVLR